MNDLEGLKETLERAVEAMAGPACPPRLAEALRHALFAGGSRLRPRLCYAVARANGVDPTEATDLAAAAVELIHCASLVIDDLPCFDDAPLRRGLPSVHNLHGEPTAVLTGLALIFGAFDLASRAVGPTGTGAAPLTGLLARAAGLPAGMTAGQAWEGEPKIVLDQYHRAKTATLFEAAAMAGALTAGADPDPWRELGIRLGEVYQVADDIRDHTGDPVRMGKPVGRDAALGRPSAVREGGLGGALHRLDRGIEAAVAAIPDCPGRVALQAFVESLIEKFRPEPEY